MLPPLLFGLLLGLLLAGVVAESRFADRERLIAIARDRYSAETAARVA